MSTKTTQKMIAFTANLVKQVYTTKYSKVSYRFLLTKLKKNFLNHIYKLDMECFTIYCIWKKNSKSMISKKNLVFIDMHQHWGTNFGALEEIKVKKNKWLTKIFTLSLFLSSNGNPFMQQSVDYLIINSSIYKSERDY